MNIQKSVAVVAAMLITAAGMAGIANYSNAAVSSANRAVDASTQVITLPAVNVHPSQQQLQQLRGGDAGTVAPANLRMPYYSYASDTASA
jgi:hypothetical protein